MAVKKKVLFIVVEAMGEGVFTYIVVLADVAAPELEVAA